MSFRTKNISGPPRLGGPLFVGLLLETVSDGVDPAAAGAVEPKLKVQMVSGRTAGGTYVTNDLTLRYRLSCGHRPLGLMGIHRTGAITVGNGHIVAIGRAVGGNDDHAALGRLDGRAIGGGNITATVELLPVEGTVSIAKGRKHPGIPRQRPQVAAGTGRATATGRFGVGVRIGVVLILLLLLLLRFLLCLFPGSLFSAFFWAAI